MFIPIDKLLTRSVRQSGLENKLIAAQIVDVANDMINSIFGPDTTHQNARAIYHKQEFLYIATLDASIRMELKFKERELIAGINEKLGKEKIKGIQLTI